MKAGMYEARSLIGERRTAYILLEDAADLRLKLHVARSALGILRWHLTGSRGAIALAALEALSDVEEG